MKPSSYWLEQAKNAFRIGRIPIIRDGDPHNLRKRLYEAARRRGYRWKFALDKSGGVVVKIENGNFGV